VTGGGGGDGRDNGGGGGGDGDGGIKRNNDDLVGRGGDGNKAEVDTGAGAIFGDDGAAADAVARSVGDSVGDGNDAFPRIEFAERALGGCGWWWSA
jgi:hypothetical protein